MGQFKSNITLEREWLRAMDKGAEKSGVDLMFTVVYAKHALQSLEMKNLVSTRSSKEGY